MLRVSKHANPIYEGITCYIYAYQLRCPKLLAVHVTLCKPRTQSEKHCGTGKYIFLT